MHILNMLKNIDTKMMELFINLGVDLLAILIILFMVFTMEWPSEK